MLSQAHQIKIEAGQQSAFAALTTAERWGSWFTPGGDRRFHRRIRDYLRTLVPRLRYLVGFCIDRAGQTPSHTPQEPVRVRLSGALDHVVSSLRAFSGVAPPRVRSCSGPEARPDGLAREQYASSVAVACDKHGEL